MAIKISLIGAGNIGGTIALLAAIKNLGNVVLVDIAKGVAKGKALDISHSLPVLQCNRKITGTTSLKQIKDSKVIVVTAGVPRKAGMSRDDLVEINLKVRKDVGKALKKYSPIIIYYFPTPKILFRSFSDRNFLNLYKKYFIEIPIKIIKFSNNYKCRFFYPSTTYNNSLSPYSLVKLKAEFNLDLFLTYINYSTSQYSKDVLKMFRRCFEDILKMFFILLIRMIQMQTQQMPLTSHLKISIVKNPRLKKIHRRKYKITRRF